MDRKRWSLWTAVIVMCGAVLLSVSAAERSLFEGRPSFKQGEERAHVVRGPYGRVHGVAPGRPARVVEKTQDHIVMDGDRTIRFDTRTEDDLDGFDFKVENKVTALRFVLRINGQPAPKVVEVGRNNAHPAANPFIVNF